LYAVEVGLKALEIVVKEKEVDMRKGRESAQEEERSEELGESGRITMVEREWNRKGLLQRK
jgi:hypothetical protein